jgi:hypothetical protein
VVISNSQETAKAQNGIRNLTADFVDHDALNRADFFLVGAVYCRALDLIAADQVALAHLLQWPFFTPLVVSKPNRSGDRMFLLNEGLARAQE